MKWFEIANGVVQKMSAQDHLAAYSMPEPNSGCHLWLAYVNAQGYGIMRHTDHKKWTAHRVAYEIHKGPIPQGMFVCHRCDVPGCVNPDHLFLGTHDDNMRDMAAKARNSRGMLHSKSLPFRKLTEDQVRKIRQAPRPDRVIAGEYGVTPGNIYSIKKRMHWRHIP